MSEEHAPRVNATRARQGRRGLHIFWVLTISLMLGAVALAIIWAANSGQLAAVRGHTQAPAPAAAANFDEPPPAARQTSETPPSKAP